MIDILCNAYIDDNILCGNVKGHRGVHEFMPMPETTKAPSKDVMGIAHGLCHHYSCDWVGTPKQQAECEESCCLAIAAAMEAFAAVANNHIRLTYESERDAAVTFKADRDALRARNEKLVEALEGLVNSEAPVPMEWKHPAYRDYAAALERARAALAADAKAIPFDDDGDGDNDTREVLFRDAHEWDGNEQGYCRECGRNRKAHDAKAGEDATGV